MKIDEWNLAGRVDPAYIMNKIQDFILALFKSDFFPWVCLVLVLNHKNWHRPIVLVLIFHWLLRGLGDTFRSASEFLSLPDEYWNYYQWPYTSERWFLGNSLASVFWIGGEIVGDWYLLLRTKAVTPLTQNLKYVYISCIAFNLVKVFGIYCHFMILPVNCNLKDEHGIDIDGIYKYRVAWWSTILAENIVGFCYDLSVICALRKQLFCKLNEYKNFSKNTFMDKFKQISEFRIFFSMIVSLIFLPFVALIVFCTLISEKAQVRYLNPDPIRQVVIAVNYTLMYIDQILLRCYMERSKTTANSSSGSVNNATSTISKGGMAHSTSNPRFDRSYNMNDLNTPISPPPLLVKSSNNYDYTKYDNPMTPSNNYTINFSSTDYLNVTPETPLTAKYRHDNGEID